MSNCCCIEVDDCSTVLADEMRRARIPHQCGECGETIQPGSLYTHERAVSDGRISTYRTCARCRNIRDEYFTCGCYWGFIREHFRDCHGFDYIFGLPPNCAPCGKKEPEGLVVHEWLPADGKAPAGVHAIAWTDEARAAVESLYDYDDMTREEGDRFEDLAERNQWLLTVEQAEWLWAMHARMRRGAQDRGVGAQWHSDDTARMRP